MRILGIDPGFRVTGWGLIEKSNGDIKILATGEIETVKNTKEIDRLNLIYKKIKEVIENTIPDQCVVEKYVPYSQMPLVWSAILLGKVSAMIHKAISDCDLDFEEVRAVEVKSRIFGNKHASKEQLRKAINIILDSDVNSYHISDALGVAIYQADRINYEDYLEKNVRG